MALGAHMRPYSYMYCAPHRDGKKRERKKRKEEEEEKRRRGREEKKKSQKGMEF